MNTGRSKEQVFLVFPVFPIWNRLSFPRVGATAEGTPLNFLGVPCVPFGVLDWIARNTGNSTRESVFPCREFQKAVQCHGAMKTGNTRNTRNTRKPIKYGVDIQGRQLARTREA